MVSGSYDRRSPNILEKVWEYIFKGCPDVVKRSFDGCQAFVWRPSSNCLTTSDNLTEKLLMGIGSVIHQDGWLQVNGDTKISTNSPICSSLPFIDQINAPGGQGTGHQIDGGCLIGSRTWTPQSFPSRKRSSPQSDRASGDRSDRASHNPCP